MKKETKKLLLPRLQVKRMEPEELPAGMLLLLNVVFHTQLSDFIVIVDNQKQIMYVKKGIPEEDVAGFVKIAKFPEWHVLDDTAYGDLADKLLETYGRNVFGVIMAAHEYRCGRLKSQIARRQARRIVPFIERQLINDDSGVFFNEELTHEIWEAGFSSGGRTARNLVGASSEYVFYLGYLMGAGRISINAGNEVSLK